VVDPVQWTIPISARESLNTLTPGPRNPISWLNQPEMSKNSDFLPAGPRFGPVAASDILREAGVLDVQRNISPTFMRVLQVLTNPGACFSIGQVLPEPGDSLAFFFNNSLSTSVAVTQSGEKFTMIDPARPELISDFCSLRTGNSSFLSMIFEASLPVLEARTLLAGIDGLRKIFGRTVLQEELPAMVFMQKDEMINLLNRKNWSAQWLRSSSQNWDLDHLTLDDLAKALQSLEDRGFCSLLPAGIRWSPSVEDLAQKMIIMNQVYELEISRLQSTGQVVRLNQTCFQAGVHDLFLLDISEDRVSLRTLSAQAFMDHVVQLATEGIRRIPDRPFQAGDATRQIFPTLPLWELRPLGTGARIPILESVQIGRSPENQVILSETSVSRAHCLLEVIEGVCWVTDLHSSNGTLVNGKRITMPTRLQAKDRLQLGILQYEVVNLKPGSTNDA
jgi:hypothetical protein